MALVEPGMGNVEMAAPQKRRVRRRGDGELVQPLRQMLALLEYERERWTPVERTRMKRRHQQYQQALNALLVLATEREFGAMILAFPSHQISVSGIKSCFVEPARRHQAHQLMRAMSTRMFALYYTQHDQAVAEGDDVAAGGPDSRLINKLRQS
jgi:hypothetical protein